jgi:hypothetical protein
MKNAKNGQFVKRYVEHLSERDQIGRELTCLAALGCWTRTRFSLTTPRTDRFWPSVFPRTFLALRAAPPFSWSWKIWNELILNCGCRKERWSTGFSASTDTAAEPPGGRPVSFNVLLRSTAERLVTFRAFRNRLVPGARVRVTSANHSVDAAGKVPLGSSRKQNIISLARFESQEDFRGFEINYFE